MAIPRIGDEFRKFDCSEQKIPIRRSIKKYKKHFAVQRINEHSHVIVLIATPQIRLSDIPNFGLK